MVSKQIFYKDFIVFKTIVFLKELIYCLLVTCFFAFFITFILTCFYIGFFFTYINYVGFFILFLLSIWIALIIFLIIKDISRKIPRKEYFDDIFDTYINVFSDETIGILSKMLDDEKFVYSRELEKKFILAKGIVRRENINFKYFLRIKEIFCMYEKIESISEKNKRKIIIKEIILYLNKTKLNLPKFYTINDRYNLGLINLNEEEIYSILVRLYNRNIFEIDIDLLLNLYAYKKYKNKKI